MSKEKVKFIKENHSMTFSILLTSSELGQQKRLIYFFNHIEPDRVPPQGTPQSFHRPGTFHGFHSPGEHTQCM